ncbi:hypothetical protein Gpo141_00006817 [Globisporangium polare]
MNKSSTSLPPIHDAEASERSSLLPRLLVPSAHVPTPPPTVQNHDLNSASRLPVPRQRHNIAPSSSSSQLKFPSLVKPQHRIPPLTDKSGKCNQEEENNHCARDQHVQKSEGNNADEEEMDTASGTSSSRVSASSGVLAAAKPVGDKNRDFIRELEEKKRKQKEDEARKERRKQKLHEKLSRKILEEAAQARQKQQAEPEENGAGDTAEQQPDDDQQEPADTVVDDKESDGEEARKRKEKVKHQKKLLKKQQALLEQMKTKQKEKQEELELEKEKERKKQEKVKKAILTAIYDANARHQLEEEQEYEQDDEFNDEEAVEEPVEVVKPVEKERKKKEPPSRKTTSGPTLAAAGSAVALLRDRKEAATPSAPPPNPQEEVPDEQKQRAKEQRDAINRKQQGYLQKLAEQRKQKQKEEEDARVLQEKRKKKIQQDAMLRHQEVAKQQQEAAAAAAQREKEESSEKTVTAVPPVDVEAMVARLSKLKDRDSQVIPEARDYISWRKRHGVRADQSVFCMTGCYPVIREELEKRGWYYNQEKVSPFFDLKWSLKSDDLKAYKLEKHQYVNHFFQNTAITTKVGLLHNLRNMVWHQSMDIDTIFPRAYDLNEPRDMETFVQDFRYGFAEGLLKELAKIYLHRKKKTSAIKANVGIVDVLLSIVRKKVKSKCPDGDEELPQVGGGENDQLEESIDNLIAPGIEELVTDLQWEALTKCQVDKPGSLRASLVYKRKVFAEDRMDASLGIEGGGGNTGMFSQAGAAAGVDTVLGASEKKQQRQVEKQRMETFSREKARLGLLLARVEAIAERTLQEVVRLTHTLEKLCPQFRINGGWDISSSSDPGTTVSNQTAAAVEADTLTSKSCNIWIVKPAGMSRGRGIRVFNNLDLLLEYADVENHKECQWVAQKYIENPLLVCKRKFDIRQWVLVTGWDPLTVWFYQDCYLRFSSEEYSMDDLSDQYVHLTNNSIQKYSDKFNDVYATEDGEIRVEGNMLHSDDFKQYIRSKLGKPEGFYEREIQQRMKDIVVASLQCVQDMVQHRPNCCELFGYDFMIDTDLTPWLIEVNSSPACDYSTPTAERYVKTGLAGIIKVIVDHREYEQKKKSGATMPEPDTGCWERIHKGEYIGKPVSSFGADFFVKGAKVQKSRGRSNKASSTTGTQATKPSSSSGATAPGRPAPDESDGSSKLSGGFVIVEEDDEEGNEREEQQDSLSHEQTDGCDGDGGGADAFDDVSDLHAEAVAIEQEPQREDANDSEADGEDGETEEVLAQDEAAADNGGSDVEEGRGLDEGEDQAREDDGDDGEEDVDPLL